MESTGRKVSMTYMAEDAEADKHLPLGGNSTDRRHIGLQILTPTVCILIITAGIGSALVSYLSLKSVSGQSLRSVVSNGSVLIDEGTKTLASGQEEVQLRALLITSLAGHLIGWSVPFVMSIIAFRLAANWLNNQDQDQRLPTPEQYALLLQMCSSSSLKSLFSATIYLGKRSKRPHIPGIIIQGFIILATVTVLSFAISLADTWLHAVASAALLSQTIPATNLSDPSLAFGIGFNTSACSDDTTSGFCNQPEPGVVWGSGDLLNRGLEVAGNASKVLSVSTLNDIDWMAIVTTRNITPNTVYVAETVGMTASCIGLAPGCIPRSVEDAESPALINCSAAVPEDPSFPLPPPNAQGTIFELFKSGMTVTQGVSLEPQQENSNVFNALVQLTYSPQPGSDTDVSAPLNPAIIYGVGGQSFVLLANCTFAVFDVIIESKPATSNVEQAQVQTMIARSNANDSTTGRLWPGILYGDIGNFLTANTFAVISSSSAEEVLAALSQEISRLTLALATGILQPVSAQAVGTVQKRLVSSYPIAPLITFLILLFLYAAITLGISIWCTFASSSVVHVSGPKASDDKKVTLMSLLHSHLTSPLSVVAMLYTHPSTRSVDCNESQAEYLERQTHTSRLFFENADTARLHAEVMINSATQERYFELRSRRVQPEPALEKGEEMSTEEQIKNLPASNASDGPIEYNPYEEHVAMSNSA